MENYGNCEFCGQVMLVDANEGASQAELDALASSLCMCPDAQSDRRKKERKKKIEKFVDKNFYEPVVPIIHATIQAIEQRDIEDVTFKLSDERTAKIWLDSDDYLRIKVKKTNEEELKV